MAAPRIPQDRMPKKTAQAATAKKAPAKRAPTRKAPAARPASTSMGSAGADSAARARAASRAAAKKAAASSTSTSSDELAAEAAPPTRPDGMPELRPLAALRRRERSTVMRLLGQAQAMFPDKDEREDLQPLAEKLTGAEDLDDAAAQQLLEDTLEDENFIEVAANSLEMLAILCDAMTIAAVDSDAFDTWVESVPDDVARQAWSWWQSVSPVGEASASSS